jgi:hypothetical protein
MTDLKLRLLMAMYLPINVLKYLKVFKKPVPQEY